MMTITVMVMTTMMIMMMMMMVMVMVVMMMTCRLVRNSCRSKRVRTKERLKPREFKTLSDRFHRTLVTL